MAARLGRPQKFDAERAKKFTDAIRAGANQRHAAQYAGLSTDTIQRWQQRDAAFAAAIREAEGSLAVGLFAKLQQAASAGNVAAITWMLERRWPHDYGRHVTEITGPDGGPIEITNATPISDDERSERIRALLERSGTRALGSAATPGPDLAPPNGTANGSLAH